MLMKPELASSKEKIDGRRLRSSRSRERIKASVVELIRSGNFIPRAVDIAQHSGLSIRSVFRHIDDMDSLAREINDDLEREIMPMFMKPYEALDWRGQMSELISKRSQIYESLLHIRAAGSLQRFRSDFFLFEYYRIFGIEKASLKAILPEAVKNDEVTFRALNHALCISSWISLRFDQGHDAVEAEAVVRKQVECLLADHA